MTDPFDTPERRQLRELTRSFVQREVVPHLDAWERAGEVPRSLHQAAAKIGLLGISFPEHVGGQGGDALDQLVVTEELIQAGGSSGLVAALFTHGIALPHIVASGNRDLIEKFVKPTLAGDLIGSLAITEPDAGSDVASLRTTAKPDGDTYVVNGSKTYITSGARADFITTAVRTGDQGSARLAGLASAKPAPAGARSGGISLLVVERGFTVTRRLEKMGWHCSDTAELSFTDVRVPVGNLVGEENSGFYQIAEQFVVERIGLAVHGYGIAGRALALTAAYCKDRDTFGKPLASRQVVRHKLVEMHRQVDVARTYTHAVVARHEAGENVIAEACLAKQTAVETAVWVCSEAVQLFGGTGYMHGTEVERHYRDARILPIGGGATEVLTDLAARLLGYTS